MKFVLVISITLSDTVTCDAAVGGLKALPGNAVAPQTPGSQGYVIRPERRRDAHTLNLFHFDGDLNTQVPTDLTGTA